MQEKDRRQIEHLIDDYLEQRRALNWSPRTIESYRSHLKVFISYLAAETDAEGLGAVTPALLRCYQAYLYHWMDSQGRGRTLATQGARLSALRSFLRDLVRTEALAHDPSSTLALPKRRQILPRVILNKREVARLLAAPDVTTPLGCRDRAVIEVLYGTGIRNAELRGLQVSDLDLAYGVAQVRHGKGGKDRVVPLGRAAAAAVRTYLASARPRLLAARGPDAITENTLFLSKTGRPLQALGVIEPLRRHARRARLRKPVTPHTLRHCCATHMLQGRADLRHIQALLGHGSIATTQIYTHVEVTDLKAVHRRCHPRERASRLR
jgi:integrase/recombinase XerD